ncbi:unnamed protein product [Withania somnifera]
MKDDDLTPLCKAEEGRFSGGDGDELVDCEFEAAQALACLAHPGPYTSTTEEQVTAIQFAQESEPKTNSQHALNYPPDTGRRLRQNLTEEEKEERRISRVLANRESARQTIRRRQAMYEELTRKAADLASENVNLKKKKELAAKEYDSLKNKNSSLRLQIAKIEKAEAVETDGASRLKPVEISSRSTGRAPAPNPTSTPTSLFNQSLMPPFFWPPIVQPFNSFLLQCSTQNISGVPSVLPSPTAGESNSTERQQSSNPGNPLYVLPLPCLIPINPQNTAFLPWSYTLDRHAESSGIHPCSTSYLNVENNQASTAQEDGIDAPHEAPLGFQPSGVHSRERVLMTAASSSQIQPGTSGQSDTHRQHSTPDIDAPCCTAGHVGDISEKISQESITCSSEKSADATAAATDARRRRKALLHLKGHHSDQFGPHH